MEPEVTISYRRAIGLITRFISGRFFEQLLSGIQAVAWQHQVDLLVVHGTPEQVALTQIGQQRVDGWLVQTYLQGLDLLAQQGKPIVTISGCVPGQPFPAVFPDNRQGMASIMESLLAQGHRRIAFVGDTSIGDIQERYEGYQAALTQHGLPFDPALVVITDSPLSHQGAWAARQLMARPADYTAVVAGNDWTAIGLMRAFQDKGRRIPDDVAVVGFDDIPEAQVTNPPLSTVRQHTDELGSTAARLLLAQMTGQTVAAAKHCVPTTFVFRESSGSNLARRISQWTRPNIESGNLWQTSLSRELVHVLLPTLPLVPPPSPAQLWPEVDKLAQLLAETVEGAAPQQLDSHVLDAIFLSPPILNANPEILVEMVRVLEAAGLVLVNSRPEATQAQSRLYALLDQLLTEIMRSYRRRQTSSQRTLNEVLQSQYNISQLLLQCPPEQVDWLRETSMYSGCLGLWLPAGDSGAPLISLAGWYQREGSSSLRAGTSYGAPQFPPLDLLPSALQKGSTTCLVLTVRTADHDWGMLAVSGPLISADPWLEDNTINILEICCGFLGMALERETLRTSLQHSSEYEQYLAERLRQASLPLIPLMEGVVLIPLGGAVKDEHFEPLVEKALSEAARQPVAEIVVDLGPQPPADPEFEQKLLALLGPVALGGTRVTAIGPGFKAGPRAEGVQFQPSLAAMLDQARQPAS